MQGMDVRIPPSPLDELGPLARVVSRVVARRTAGERLHLFTTLWIHRRLFRVWLPFAGTMLLRTRLPRADVELLVLRTAYNCSSPYEFAQHVTIARQEGIGAADVAAIAGGDLHSLTLRQRLLLTAADELHSSRVVGSATWRALSAMLEPRQLLELCMLVGHYEMLAMTLNSLGVEPERGAVAALGEPERRMVEGLRASLDAEAA
jgi:4-carboxymuconolactone decarboxylase